MANVLDSGGGAGRARRTTTPAKKAPAPIVRTAQARARDAQNARNRMQAANDTPEDRQQNAWTQAVRQYSPNATQAQVTAARVAGINSMGSSPYSNYTPGSVASTSTSGGSGRRGGGGGGGGGGAAVDPAAMVNYLTNLFRGAGPADIDLPDAPAFDPTSYDQALGSWNAAGVSDQGVIDQAGRDMLAFLNNNYRNAYADPTVGTGGEPLGLDPAALRRIMELQGVDPNSSRGLSSVAGEAARAASMAGSWRQAMSANEEQAQRNRIANSMSQTSQSTNALNAALNAGRLQIGQARNAGQQAAAQRQWEQQVQEATMNAERRDSYRNAVMQALISFAQANPEAAATMPDFAALGL